MWIGWLVLFSCSDKGGSDGAAEWAPDAYCPGDPSGMCGDADGAMKAGAAALTITPTCFESFDDQNADANWDEDEGEVFLDCGCDRLCPGDPGYSAADEGEGDGEFQAVWMAGFENTHPAQGIRDDLWARVLVVEKGETRIGIVALDVVGWFYGEVLEIREMADAAGLDLDHVVVLSTHVHEGPDTMGLWGEKESATGVDADYNAWVRERAVEALSEAVSQLREVGSFVAGSVDASTYAEVGILNVLRDARDPKVVDTTLSAAWIRDTSGETIATLAHFGNHPESMADENGLLTSDYSHALREALEGGIDQGAVQRPGYGGVAIFLTGTVGGMMTPLGIDVTDVDGTQHVLSESGYNFDRTDAIGRVKADMAMDAIEGGEEAADLPLSFARVQFKLPVDNYGFQAMFLTRIFDRDLYDYDPSEAIGEGNIPNVLTEMDFLQLGPIEILTIPGELLPELAIGGYDGSAVGTTYDVIVDSGIENPPDLSAAPAGPYLKDRLVGDHRWILGLANDELGYIIPEYNFVLDETLPYFEEAGGDHYEETNSLGPSTAGIVNEQAAELMEWVSAR